MNVSINLTPVHSNQRVPILLARIDATAYRAGEIKALIAAVTLTNVLMDLTAVHTTHSVSILRAHTYAIAYQVGEITVIIRVSILMNVPQDCSAALPTLTALTRKARTDVTATAAFINLEALAIVSISLIVFR